MEVRDLFQHHFPDVFSPTDGDEPREHALEAFFRDIDGLFDLLRGKSATYLSFGGMRSSCALAFLSEHKEYDVRMRVLKNPLTPWSIALRLLGEASVEVKLDLIKNDNDYSRPALVSFLCRDPDFSVRIACARLRFLSPEDQRVLAYDPERHVARTLSENPNIVPDLKTFLESVFALNQVAFPPSEVKDDESIALRYSKYPHLSEHRLNQLAHLPFASVRLAVARHPTTCEMTLRELLIDPETTNIKDSADLELQQAVAVHRHAPANVLFIFARTGGKELRRAVAESQSSHLLNPGLQGILSKDSDPDVREAIALNALSLPHTLQKLSDDHDVSVRRAVAGNRNTSEQVLEALVQDEDHSVVEEAISNPNCPRVALLSVIRGSYDEALKKLAQRRFDSSAVSEEVSM